MTINICVCGGGNVAHTAAAILGSRANVSVSVLTRNADDFSRQLSIHYGEHYQLIGNLNKVSTAPEAIIPEADIVLLAVPSFAREGILRRISPYLKKQPWVGALPGLGGFDWQAKTFLSKQSKFFGFQRVPWICRLIKRGHIVSVTGIRNKVFIAGSPSGEIKELASILSSLLGLEVNTLDNYLAITLGFANPTFHSARLYTLFKDNLTLNHRPYFYRDWDQAATSALLQLDKELQLIRHELNINSVPTALENFNVLKSSQLTDKIRNIKALRDIQTPMKPVNQRWKLDISSRYLLEDIEHGIMVHKAIANLVGANTPTIDKVIRWAQTILGKTYHFGRKALNHIPHETAVPYHNNILDKNKPTINVTF